MPSKTSMKYHLPPTGMAITKKIITRIDEDVEKLELL
jgi:hypothetical protein